MIRIAIVEDDHDVREDLQDFLNAHDNFDCFLVAESVENLLATMPSNDLPDIILMDIGLPGMSGIHGITIIKDRHPEIDIIMVTNFADSHKIFDALCAGASGYLLKNAPFSELVASIETLHQGGAPMSPQIARKVIQYFREPEKPPTPKPESPLSPKEKEVVVGLVDGLSYKMIADRMFISVETVRSHIKNIYKKLHVHSKAEVIRKSLQGEI